MESPLKWEGVVWFPSRKVQSTRRVFAWTFISDRVAADRLGHCTPSLASGPPTVLLGA